MTRSGYQALLLLSVWVIQPIYSLARPFTTMSLEHVLQQSLSVHPSVKARIFDIQAAQQGLTAAQGLFDLSLTSTLDIADDLVTIPNPIEMGARTPIETQRYSAELNLSQPLRWGTVLGFGMRQSQIETTNPFRNCVPGIISDQCYESTLTLSINQPLLRGRSSRANLSEERRAQLEVKRVRNQLKIELVQQAQRIASTYLQMTLAQSQLELDRQHLTLIEKRIAEAEERIKLGMLAQTEIYTLKAALSQRLQNVELTTSRVSESRLALKEQCQMPIGEVEFPRQWFTPLRINGALSYPLDRSWLSDPQVLAISMIIQQLEVQKEPLIDAQKSKLDVGLIWSQSGLGEKLNDALGTLPDNESRFYGVSLSYTQTISDRAEALSAQLAAQIQVQEAEKKALIQQLKISWIRALSQLKTQKQQLAFAQEAKQFTTLSAQAAYERFQEGRGTLFEVLELQNQAFISQTQVIAIEHEIAQRVIDLWALNDELLERFGVVIDD